MSNQNGSGPKTAFGKKRSSQNARRHGLFSASFSLSAAEAAEYEKLSSDFQKELKPDNSFLDPMFQHVVACFWRVRIAHGYEQQELQKLSTAENEESDEKPQRVGESFPYGLKGRQREQVIEFLDHLRRTVEKDTFLHPALEEPITQACGADFWKTLAEWAPLSIKRIMVAKLCDVAVAKSEYYGTELLEGAEVSPEEKLNHAEADGIKQMEMMCKIIDIYKNLMINDPRAVESRDGMLLDKRVNRLDLALRYGTMARRDFYRALEEYRTAKNAE